MTLCKKILFRFTCVTTLFFCAIAHAGSIKSKEFLSLEDGVTIPLIWLRPTGEIFQPRALVIVQHGMMRKPEKMMALAESLVAKNIEVVLPGVTDSQYLDPLFPEMFVNAFEKLHKDAQGVELPKKLLLAGFSAGARFLSHVAGLLYNNQHDIKGVLLLDPVVGELPEHQLGPRLPLPYFTILAKPSRCNADGNSFPLFQSRRFETLGFRLKTASHCDFEGQTSDPICYLYCGSSPKQNVQAVQLFASEWLSGLIDSETPHVDFLPGGKVFQQWQQQGLFDTIFN